MGEDMFSRLRRFDAYPKTLEDFRIKTFSGAFGGYTAGHAPRGQWLRRLVADTRPSWP